MSAGLTDSSPTVDALDADNSPMLDFAATARRFTRANSEGFSRTAINPGTADFALSGWVYVDTLPSYFNIASCGAGSTAQQGFDFFVRSDPAGQVGLYFNATGAARVSLTCNDSFAVGQWQHWVLNFDRDGNMQLFVDGTSKGTSDISGHADSLDPALDLFLGRASWGGYLDGRMGRMIWHTKVLDSDAITLLRNGGKGRLYGSFTAAEKTSLGIYAAWDGTEASGNLIDSHVGDGSLDLTDGNTVTSASGLTAAPPFSIHVRAQCTTKPGSGVSEAVYEFGQTAGANNNMRIAFRNQGGTFLIRAVDADTLAAATIDSSAISASTWYSILFVKRSFSDRQLYVNTTSAGADTSTVNSPSMQRLRLFASPAALATRSSDNVYLSSMGIWDFDISADSDAMRRLNIGQSETSVRPDQLVAAWDFVSQPSAVYERDQIYDMNDPSSAEEPAYSPTVEPNRFYPPRRGRWDYSRKPGRLNGRAIA